MNKVKIDKKTLKEEKGKYYVIHNRSVHEVKKINEKQYKYKGRDFTLILEVE